MLSRQIEWYGSGFLLVDPRDRTRRVRCVRLRRVQEPAIFWGLRRMRSKMRSGVIAARPRFYRQRFTFDQQLSDIDFRHWGKK